jgi:Fe-S cluster biosynthesis and repair protein YggX/Tfp pilus assembly protein PilF
MSQLHDRIAQFRKMSTDDPDNELAHYRLGQLLAEAGEHAEAIRSFERTLEISPQFSKVFELLGTAWSKFGDTAKAIEVLTTGWKVADERGDKMPRDAMAGQLRALGAAVPESQTIVDDGPETGFKCARPICAWGKRAKPMTVAPMQGEIGQRLLATVCQECWTAWLKDQSIKVVNELRLDLSSEFGQAEYDKYLREFFGFDES